MIAATVQLRQDMGLLWSKLADKKLCRYDVAL
jgi:hypothetical protein